MLPKVLWNVLKKTAVELFGEEKQYTQNAQIVAGKASWKILCADFNKGRRHDFKLLKDSKICFKKESKCMIDTGYQGIQRLHDNNVLPKKKSKKNPLTKEDKKQNQRILSIRITITNLIREVKIFRILAEKYRSRPAVFP